MRTVFPIVVFVASAVLALGADKPADLTGAGPDSFKAHLGKTVALSGRMEQGMQGPCLFGATPTNVVFYVIPDMPSSGRYAYPAAWERLMHKRVRVTGKLRFRSFDRTNNGPFVQIPPDYYYMVLQRTRIEGLETK